MHHSGICKHCQMVYIAMNLKLLHVLTTLHKSVNIAIGLVLQLDVITNKPSSTAVHFNTEVHNINTKSTK